METARTTHKNEPAKPIAFPGPEKSNPFPFTKRATVLCAVEKLFGASLGGKIPPVEILFAPPTIGRAAEEFANEKDPVDAFRRNGPVSWQEGRIIYFNGWKLPPTEEKRASALAHEMAHVLLAVYARRHGQVVHDRQAYMCAAEGTATFAEIESRRASGIEWKGFPEGMPEEYHLGFAFFNSMREAAGGVEAAFRLIASNLPRNSGEIRDPHLYLMRTSENAAQAAA